MLIHFDGRVIVDLVSDAVRRLHKCELPLIDRCAFRPLKRNCHVTLRYDANSDDLNGPFLLGRCRRAPWGAPRGGPR
jgi:hypothetical protein